MFTNEIIPQNKTNVYVQSKKIWHTYQDCLQTDEVESHINKCLKTD